MDRMGAYVRVRARCTIPVEWFRANNPSGKGPFSLAEKILYAHLENPLGGLWGEVPQTRAL